MGNNCCAKDDIQEDERINRCKDCYSIRELNVLSDVSQWWEAYIYTWGEEAKDENVICQQFEQQLERAKVKRVNWQP